MGLLSILHCLLGSPEPNIILAPFDLLLFDSVPRFGAIVRLVEEVLEGVWLEEVGHGAEVVLAHAHGRRILALLTTAVNVVLEEDYVPQDYLFLLLSLAVKE